MSSNLIFYDTETTGIHRDFSQIIQCGSVLTDYQLKINDQQNIGSAPLPWVIPQPIAMLTNKKIKHVFLEFQSQHGVSPENFEEMKSWIAKN